MQNARILFCPLFPLILTLTFAFISLQVLGQNKAKATVIPIDSSFSVAAVAKKIKRDFPLAIPAIDSLPEGVQEYRNMVYATLEDTRYGKRELHLDIFRPQKDERRELAAVIMINGGGWRSGTRSMQVPMAQMLAARGFVTIPVEYQLSLEAKFPAAVHNIKSAIRWVKANSRKYHIDTARIAVFGCSAGGQLAALTGLTNNIPFFEGRQGITATDSNRVNNSNVSAIVDIDGVLNFLAPESLNLKRKPNSADVFWLGGTFENKPEVWKMASPIYWATEHTAIPMLFINSGFPRFHAGQDELISMMHRWKVYTQVEKVAIQLHPFWLFHPWVDKTVVWTAAFLHKVLP